MKIPFLNRLPLKQIVTGEANGTGERAREALAGILADLPELLMACVVDGASGKVLAFYTTHSNFNPNQISLRNAKLLRTMNEALAVKAWPGGLLTDVSVMLEDQLHHLRPMNDGKWYCFLAVRTAEANLGIAKETVRRHTT